MLNVCPYSKTRQQWGRPGSAFTAVWLCAFGLLLSGPAWTAIEIGGSIGSNMTLQAGETYHITSNLLINPGVTLTIPAATVLKAGPGIRIQVDGTLVATGTATDAVHFTEIRDSSVGVDLDPDNDPAPRQLVRH